MKQNNRHETKKHFEGKDIAEVTSVLISSGNRYSRRTLRFFRWFCKWVPVSLMAFHFYATWDFGHNEHAMFIPHEDNALCYAFIYFMLYVLPMVIILASRFFFLCWRYRIPFFYFFGVNAIHLCFMNWFTTSEMVVPHYCLMAMIGIMYAYGFTEMFFDTKLGRKLVSL